MSDSTVTFFDAWKIEDANVRLAKLTSALTERVRYDDPRTPETVTGIADLNTYVGMFSSNAPCFVG